MLKKTKNVIVKKTNGAFYTVHNPFLHPVFDEWVSLIDDFKNKTILEPFCGTNNIPDMFKKTGYNNDWFCCDIDTNVISKNKTPDFKVHINNSLFSFPKNYEVSITNPPFLAKNIAKKNNLNFPKTKYDNLYKFALFKMLKNLSFISVILPESFIVQKKFKERLFSVVSLNKRIFSDTEYPVCLAFFVPWETDYYSIYSNNDYLGDSSDIENILKNCNSYPIKFNNSEGQIGLYNVDKRQRNNISFVKSEEIDQKLVKKNSRNLTIIKIEKDVDIDQLISECNNLISIIRNDAGDILLTSFRGLKKDGRYRRRLTYRMARHIINQSIDSILQNKNNLA